MPRRVDAAGTWEKFSGNNRNMQHLQLHLHVLAGGFFFHCVLQWSTKVTLYSCLVVCSVMWLLYGQCHEILRMQGEQEIVETLWGNCEAFCCNRMVRPTAFVLCRYFNAVLHLWRPLTSDFYWSPESAAPTKHILKRFGDERSSNVSTFLGLEPNERKDESNYCTHGCYREVVECKIDQNTNK